MHVFARREKKPDSKVNELRRCVAQTLREQRSNTTACFKLVQDKNVFHSCSFRLWASRVSLKTLAQPASKSISDWSRLVVSNGNVHTSAKREKPMSCNVFVWTCDSGCNDNTRFEFCSTSCDLDGRMAGMEGMRLLSMRGTRGV
eukprot:3213449-Rhodomonas_salina.4